MLGAIVGDIVGSIYEFENHKSKEFPLFQEESFFTDDSVLTCATALAILDGENYGDLYRKVGLSYPDAGYGGMFIHWLIDDTKGPYDSFGNGSAMRVSPVGWAFDSVAEALDAAKSSAEVTHNHVEGIKGAQATALAILRARTGHSQDEILLEVAERFEYDMSVPVSRLREFYDFDVTCQGTVPQAIRCFFEADDFEDAIRNAISIGGDSDTLAAITGSIAEATFGIPDTIANTAYERLDEPLADIVSRFYQHYMPKQRFC